MHELPIDKIKADFTLAIKERHLVVQAETGSGKSTRLPLWAKEEGKVLVIEPRRVACTALAGYVAQLDNSTLGDNVGYAIRFDAQYQPHSQIIFVTPGIALRWLSDTALRDFKIIIIDEFHERRWDTDLLLALLKKKAKHRLVLTSATFDSQQLSAYLGGERLLSEGRTFPVTVENLASSLQAMPDLNGLESKIRSAVEQALTRDNGDILVFLPGRREITACLNALQSLSHQYPDVNVIPLHAAESKQTQQQALNPSSNRKVVLATNIAETSLTIPGVTFVIDSGLERRTHQRNGRTVLGLHAISKASAEQRKGRAGRTQAGTCLRLYGEFAPLEATTPPELLREELVEPMLAAASCGENLFQLALPSPPPESALKRARDKLVAMQAINDAGEITEHGKVLYPLPVDTLFAHAITAMPTPDLRCAMIDTVCALGQSQRLFQLPNTENGHKVLKKWQAHACDISTLISLMRSKDIPEELQYDARALAEAKVMSNKIRQTLSLPTLKNSPEFTLPALQHAIALALPELVFVRRKKRRQALGNGYSEVTVGRDSRFVEDAEAAIVLDQHIIPGKGTKQNLALATCMSPITLKQMCKWKMGDVHLGRTLYQKRKILVETHRTYAGREIEVEQSPPNTTFLPFALSDLILRNKLYPGVAENLYAELHAWKIHLSLEKRTETVPEPREYLAEKLIALGLESIKDMELIDADDLAFNGVPDWQRKEIDSLYPQRLTLASLQLNVEYQLDRKTVIIEKHSGTRKTDPKRWELPKWQGLKICYQVASRLVDIR
ncbi:MAG: HrpA-like RNA helicase [Flavobacteriales bacterium]|jgi:HrpA-like RNA helicase